MVLLASTCLWAQEEAAAEEESKLQISGSVDTYYKYDFAGQSGNIPTSFAGDHNSLSIGMLDLVLEKSTGKASFLAELAFGPRNFNSAGPASGSTSTFFSPSEKDSSGMETSDAFFSDFAPRLQNLYVSYAFTDQLSLTAGYMGTFVGYEIISPTGNFNYSTSYLFTNGPFQNAGVKLDYAFSDRFAVMVGAFNPWNVYTADPSIGPTSLGAQIYVSPVDGWDVYINGVTGGESGTEIDLTTTFQVSDKLMLGLNAASYTDGADSAGTFMGAAAYVNYALTDGAALGFRYEYFNSNIVFDEDASVNAFTLSANLGNGAITFIPEVRYDVSSANIFLDSEGNATSNSAIQALVAAVYAF